MADDTTLLEISFDTRKLLTQAKEVVSKLNSFFSKISTDNLKTELNNVKTKYNVDFMLAKQNIKEKEQLNKANLNESLNNIKKEYLEKKVYITRLYEEEKQQLKNKQNDIREEFKLKLANLEKEKKEKLSLLEQNIKNNKQLFASKKQELEELYNKEKKQIQDDYNLKIQNKQKELQEELKNIDKQILNNKNLYNIQKQELKELYQLEVNQQKQVYNEKINNINSEKQKALEEINAKKQAELNAIRELNEAKKKVYDTVSYIPNKIIDNISNMLSTTVNKVRNEFTNLNRFIIDETKKAFEKGFEDFKLSDVYIKLIQSMRSISGQAEDVISGKLLPELPYSKVVEDMSIIANKYGKEISTVSKYTQKAVESGLEYEQALQVVDTAIMGSIASHSKLEDVLNGLLRSIYIYGDANKGYADMVERSAKTLNMFMIASARGSLSLGDFSKQLGNVAPQAKRIGIDLPELAVLFSAMAQRMRNSAEASTALLNVFNKLSKPIQGGREAIAKINKELERIGKPTIDIGQIGVEKEGGGIKLLLRLKEVMLMLDKKQQEVFKNLLFNEIRAAKGFESLIDVLDVLLKEQELLIKNTDHLNKAYDTMTDSIDFKVNTIKNRIVNNFEIMYFNNRRLVNTMIDSIANYIDKYISYIYNFINSILNNSSLFSSVLQTIQNFETAFNLALRSILMFINAFNRIFGTGGSMSSFTNDIGTGFLRLMHNISAIVLSISSAFYGYARAVAYVSQVIGFLINWFINLGRVILSNDKLITVLATVTIGATLIGVLYKLGTAIYGVISSFGALGITLGGTFTMLAGLITLIGMLATGFLNLGNIIDEFSKFKNDMAKMKEEMEAKQQRQANFNALLKEEEALKKKIVELSIKKDKTEKDKEELKNEKDRLKLLQDRIKKSKLQSEKLGTPVIDLRPVDLNEIEKNTKQITDKWLSMIKNKQSTGDLNLDLIKKDKNSKDKLNKGDLRNRLNEIEDVYKQHIENTEGLFKAGKIDEYEKQKLFKIAETFRIVSLMLLKEGKEFQDGYANAIKQIKVDDLSLLDNNQVNNIKKAFKTIAITNKDELKNLTKQKEEMNKRIEQSNTNVIDNISKFNWDNYVRNTEKQTNEIRKQNEEFLVLNEEHLNKYTNDTVDKLANLEGLKAIFNEKSFKNRKEEIERENNKLIELQKILINNLLQKQIEFNRQKEEEELNSLKRQYDSGLLNQEIYENKILEIRKKYLKQREGLVENFTNVLRQNKTLSNINNILPIKEINEIKKQNLENTKQLIEEELNTEINKNNRIREYRIRLLKEQLTSDMLLFNERKKILDELLKLSKNNIDEQIDLKKEYTNRTINEFNKLSDIVGNVFKEIQQGISKAFESDGLEKQIRDIKNITNLSEGLLDSGFQQVQTIFQINKLTERRNELENKLNGILDKNSEEYKKTEQALNDTTNLIATISSGNKIAIAMQASSIIIKGITNDLQNAKKYANEFANEFEKTVENKILIHNIIFSTLLSPLELIANIFGQTFKKQYEKQIKEITDVAFEHFKKKFDEVLEQARKIADTYYEMLDKITNKQKELDNLKVNSYYREKRLIDDLFLSKINQHKERLRQIKREREDEEKAIKAVKELREQRYEDKQKKANAQKRLNEELQSRNFGEHFYRQTTEEFKTRIEQEEQDIKNKYEVLGEIDFEEYQRQMRELAVKKASYWRRRIQNISSPDDPESAKTAKEKQDLETRKKALEQARLIAQLNKDNIKVGELDKEIEKIANQIVNLDQILGNNKSLKFRLEATKEFNEAQKSFLENFYDEDMEQAIKQDNERKQKIEALKEEERVVTKQLEDYKQAYSEASTQLFNDYNDGTDKWYKNMEKRQNQALQKAGDLAEKHGINALQNISDMNNSNAKNMEIAYERLKGFYRGIVDDTDQAKKNIADIVTDLNIATNKIIDLRSINKSVVPDYYKQQETQASILQSDIIQQKSVTQSYRQQNKDKLSNQYNPQVQKEIDDARQSQLKRLQDAGLITEYQARLGVSDTSGVKAVDYLINKYGLSFDKAVSILNKSKINKQNVILTTFDTKELDYLVDLERNPNKYKTTQVKASNNSTVNKAIEEDKNKNIFQRIGGFFGNLIQGVGDFFGNLFSPKSAIPKQRFASGGVIDKPTVALMGEAGAETVFNARQMRNLFNMVNNNQIPNNSTVNNLSISINNPVIRNESDINKLADIVSQKITKQLVRQI